MNNNPEASNFTWQLKDSYYFSVTKAAAAALLNHVHVVLDDDGIIYGEGTVELVSRGSYFYKSLVTGREQHDITLTRQLNINPPAGADSPNQYSTAWEHIRDKTLDDFYGEMSDN